MSAGRWWLSRQRAMFRYGQAAIDAGTPSPLRRVLWRSLREVWGSRAKDIAPGAMIVQKDTGVDRTALWVGAVLHDQDQDTITAEVRLTDDTDPAAPPRHHRVDLHWFGIDERECEITGWSPGTRFFHTHLTVEDLAPDRWYTASVRVPGLPAATCRVRTLPPRLEVGRSLSVFTASCYDADTDHDDRIDAAYRTLERSGVTPDLTWITGDAVYADAPWWLYGTIARHTPRTYLLLEYWTAWGMQQRRGDRPRPGLRALLTKGPNWFLPDDHEFWNNWPHSTVTSRHSYGNIGRAARNSLRRRFARLGPAADVVVPVDPGPSPDTDFRAQNYLPVHPDEWGAWSRGAFDLFGSFQTRSVRDRAEDRISWGSRDDEDTARPPRGGPPGKVHAPLNQLLQTIDLDPVRVALLDTRTRRVRKHDHARHSAFVDPAVLDEMLAVAGDAPVFVLVLAQPALTPPAKVPARFKLTFDRGMQDYRHQYQRFWTGLFEARAGRPTITIGGDIHRSYVGFAPSLSLVEVVASPISFVEGVTMLGLERRFAGPATDYSAGTPLLDVKELFAGPDDVSPPVAGAAVSLGCLGPDQAGFATLTLTRESAGPVRLDVRLHPVEELARGEDTCAGPFSFRLHADGTTTPSVERL